MSIIAFRSEKYDAVYGENRRGIALRRQNDPAFTVSDLEGILKHLYVLDGLDYIGRGELGDIISQASIDAHEVSLAEWKTELGEDPGSGGA